MASQHSSVSLYDGTKVPALGLGTWKIPQDVAAKVVEDAIRIGYRHIDCACDYANEREVGEGIKNAINAGVCRREDLFVVSKLWNTYHAEEHVYGALHRSLSDLQLEYVDLYLIHFPISLKYVPFEKRYPPGWTFDPDSVDAKQRKIILEKSPVHKTWRAMEGLVEKGLVQHIGVCNFNVSLLMDLVAHANIMPAMLQVEMHPRLQQTKLLEFCRHLEIAVTAFSPFGSIGYVELNMDKGHSKNILQESLLCAISERHGKSPAQVLLRWALQRGVCVIPKTSKSERLRENMSVFDLSLTDEDMNAINSLEGGHPVRYNDPGEFGVDMGLALPIYD